MTQRFVTFIRALDEERGDLFALDFRGEHHVVRVTEALPGADKLSGGKTGFGWLIKHDNEPDQLQLTREEPVTCVRFSFTAPCEGCGSPMTINRKTNDFECSSNCTA